MTREGHRPPRAEEREEQLLSELSVDPANLFVVWLVARLPGVSRVELLSMYGQRTEILASLATLIAERCISDTPDRLQILERGRALLLGFPSPRGSTLQRILERAQIQAAFRGSGATGAKRGGLKTDSIVWVRVESGPVALGSWEGTVQLGSGKLLHGIRIQVRRDRSLEIRLPKKSALKVALGTQKKKRRLELLQEVQRSMAKAYRESPKEPTSK